MVARKYIPQDYIEELLKFVEECRRRGLIVLPARGYSSVKDSVEDAVDECKRPVIPRGYIKYELDYTPADPDPWSLTEEKIKSLEAVAVCIPAINNRLIFVDIEGQLLDKLLEVYARACRGRGSRKRREVISKISQLIPLYTSCKDDLKTAVAGGEVSSSLETYCGRYWYIEATPNLGLHIAARIDGSVDYIERIVKSASRQGLLDFRFRGVAVVHPSRFYIFKEDKLVEVRRYVKLSSVDIFDTGVFTSLWEDYIKLIVEVALPKTSTSSEVHVEARTTVTTQEARGGEDEKSRVLPTQIHVELRKISEKTAEVYSKVITTLSPSEVLALVERIADVLQCGRCVKPVLEHIREGKPLPIPAETAGWIKVPRGLHAYFEYELFGTLYILGVPSETAVKIAEMLRYVDPETGSEHIPETDPDESLKRVYRYGTITIAKKGMCPYRIAAKYILGRDPAPDCRTCFNYKLNWHVKIDVARGRARGRSKMTYRLYKALVKFLRKTLSQKRDSYSETTATAS